MVQGCSCEEGSGEGEWRVVVGGGIFFSEILDEVRMHRRNGLSVHVDKSCSLVCLRACCVDKGLP